MGQKSGQRVKNWPNKNQVASDLLRESTDSVLRAAEGIHQFCPQSYWGNPLVDNFSLRPAEGIHRFCPQSYWGNPSILSSELLRESINSVLRPTEGILLLTISASDLLRESTDSVIGATEGIHQFCHPTYWGNPHEYIFHTDGWVSSLKNLSGHLLFNSLPLEAHVVAICLRVHLSSFGH